MPVREKHTKQAEKLEFLDELFRSIWARIVPTLGVTNVRSMLTYALNEASTKYPLLKEVRVRDDGVRLDALHTEVKHGTKKPEEVYEALREYLATLIHLLAQLTGEVVSRQVRELIEKIKREKHITSLII